jgi:hypothetical protein
LGQKIFREESENDGTTIVAGHILFEIPDGLSQAK